MRVEPVAMDRSASGQVFGRIWLSIGGVAFPDGEWSDSVVVVLTWWLEAIEATVADPLAPQRLQFMDGPFYAILSAEAQGALGVQGYRRSRGGDVAVTERAKTSGGELRDDIRRAAVAILRECEARGWSSADTQQLAQRVGTS